MIPLGMTMPELALRWILADPAVSTIIPGMRKPKHAEANMAVSDGKRLDPEAGAAAQGPPLGSNADEMVALTVSAVCRGNHFALSTARQ